MTEEDKKLSKKKANKKYRLKNKQKISEDAKKYYLENKEKLITYFHKYKKENKEIFLKSREKYKENNNEYIKTDFKKRYLKNKEYYKDQALKRMYGITLHEYNIILENQNNSCAICKIHQDNLNIKLAVDHNHTTGEIRGLLCSSCNQGIGLLKENIFTLEEAIKYLNKSNNKETLKYEKID